MPKAAEKQIRRQGGTARYRTLKKGDKTMTCAVTKKAGPRGGHTVCWEDSPEEIVRKLLDD